jgi:hypothetical protein
MEQDLRELFRKSDSVEPRELLKEGHEVRFEKKLDKAFPKRNTARFLYVKIAAAVVLILAAGYFLMQMLNSNELKNTPEIVNTDKKGANGQTISLGDISPNLKKVEDYYVANIYLELSEIEVTKENKSLFNEYMLKLSELNKEYENLNVELADIGPNEPTITALIDNLQLRLQLLYQLKEKLNELKETKNDDFNDKQI